MTNFDDGETSMTIPFSNAREAVDFGAVTTTWPCCRIAPLEGAWVWSLEVVEIFTSPLNAVRKVVPFFIVESRLCCAVALGGDAGKAMASV